jgi:hypothetical protein
MIAFISGLGGTGKTTLVEYFKSHPLLRWAVYDFDDGSEPCPHVLSEHLAWRMRENEYWLSIAARNAKQNINTMIIGMCLYPRQIREMAERMNIDSSLIRYAYLICESAERKRRLFAQNAPQRWREVPWHEEFLSVMRNECEKELDTTNKSIEQIAAEIIEWLEGYCSECGKLLVDSQFFRRLVCRNHPLCKVAEKENGSALSYLMGADDIQDKDLENVGILIKSRTNSGSRKLEILKNYIPEYITLIVSKLNSGFWNEIVADDKIIFIFKHDDGSVKEYELTPENEREIALLCEEFNDEPSGKTTNVYKYLSENDYYHDYMMKYYADMVNINTQGKV